LRFEPVDEFLEIPAVIYLGVFRKSLFNLAIIKKIGIWAIMDLLDLFIDFGIKRGTLIMAKWNKKGKQKDENQKLIKIKSAE